MKVAIVGLGYVGLPLSLQFARSGARVTGLDIDPEKVNAINSGRSYIKHIESAAIAQQLQNLSPCRIRQGLENQIHISIFGEYN